MKDLLWKISIKWTRGFVTTPKGNSSWANINTVNSSAFYYVVRLSAVHVLCKEARTTLRFMSMPNCYPEMCYGYVRKMIVGSPIRTAVAVMNPGFWGGGGFIRRDRRRCAQALPFPEEFRRDYRDKVHM